MKQQYKHYNTRSQIDLCTFHEDFAVIKFVGTPKPFRGKGGAETLLQIVCREADIENLALVLEIIPSASYISYERLRRWYERHGFGKVREDMYWRHPYGNSVGKRYPPLRTPEENT